MKLVLILALLYVVSLADQKYDNVTKANGIEITSYGTSASKGIRAIGRSYAYQLIKKQQFTDYVEAALEIFNNDTLEPLDQAKGYAESYTVHVAAVGAGILVAIFLGIGFCFSPLCCCICNKSQKQDSAMAMWRMIWGTILVILLAANIAGLAILVVSGQQLLTLEGDTTDTIITLGDGLEGYFEETNEQIEELKTNQIKVFIKELEPLVDDAIKASVKAVQDDTVLKPEIGNTVAALNGLGTALDSAVTNVDSLSTNINLLSTTLTDINAHLATCKEKVEQCDTDHSNACSDQGLQPASFDASFDPAVLNAAKIEEAKTSLDKLKSFPETDGKTLQEWATFVQTTWDGLYTDIVANADIADAIKQYTDALNEAEGQFSSILSDDVQSQLTKFQEQISEQKSSQNKSISENLAYIKDLMFLKVKEVEVGGEDPYEDVSEDLITMTKDGPGKYAVFAVFVLICIILGLLVLTVLIGLLSTVFGCCKVSDDVLPTERDSGPCGNLLMCTSYCSVILCAFATLVAAILVTVVIASEGTCKQYSDGKLIGGFSDLGEALGQDLDLDEMLITALKLEDGHTMNIEDVLESCAQNETFFKALDLKQDTNLFGMFSFDSMKEEVDNQIANFNVEDALKDLDFEPELLNDDAKADITNSKTSLDDYDFAAMKTTVADTGTTAIADMDDYINKMGDLAGQAGFEYMADCETALTDIRDTQIPAADTHKAALDTPLNDMVTIKTDIVTKIDELLSAIGKMDDRFASTEFSIKDVVLVEVNKAIATAKTLVSEFIDFLFGQFRTSIGNCQPIAAVYHTILNYTCDGILIHITLLYCALSLVGISLLFYMCVSRCLARYFIKFSQLHPEDEGGNGWGPYPGHYAQTKL